MIYAVLAQEYRTCQREMDGPDGWGKTRKRVPMSAKAN